MELKVKTRDNGNGAGKPRLFISYRHIDRNILENVIEDILDLEYGFDCAIWYDANLHPGKSFDEEIRHALNHTNLFVLVVTSHTFKAGSYIVEKEIPYAQHRCIPILPIVVSDFNTNEANDILGGLHCIDKRNPNFKSVLKEYLYTTLFSTEMKTEIKLARAKEGLPIMTIKEMYLIGMGYLMGVEVDISKEKGCELITAAALGKLYEANIQLLHMYRYGQGVSRNYMEALKWGERSISIANERWIDDPNFENTKQLAEVYCELGELFYEQRKIFDSNIYFKKQIDLWRKFLKNTTNFEARRLLCWSLERLGNSLFENQDYIKACECFEEMQIIAEKLVDERGIDLDIRTLSWSHGWQGMVYEHTNDYITAGNHYELALSFDRELADRIQSEQAYLDLVESINKMGDMCMHAQEFDAAKKYYDESVALCQMVCKKYKTFRSTVDLAVCYDNLGLFYEKKQETAMAIDMYMSALRIRNELVESYNNIESMSLLALSYYRIGRIFDKDYLKKSYDIYKGLFEETGLKKYKEKMIKIELH